MKPIVATALAATVAATALLPQATAPAKAAPAKAAPALTAPALTAPAGAVPAGAVPARAASAVPAQAAPGSGIRLGSCAAGEFCLWQKPDFQGKRYAHELSGTDIESCVPLPAGADAQALANRTGRPVTTYQSAQCAETGDFDTYPGRGSWVPQSPYKVRAFKVWEN
jgi:hypothetical protein